MAVLVTGGAGYIGSHMTLDLLEAGEQVVVLDDLSTGRHASVAPEAEFIEGKVGDEALVGALLRQHEIKEVLHFAASIIVPESHTDPLKYYLNNTGQTAALIRACVEGGVERFIFSSTAAVYGVTDRDKIDEETPLGPISPYGASKMMSERVLRDVAEAHPMKFTLLRYFNVAGADPEGRTGQTSPIATHLIKIASEAAVGKREGMKIFGDDYDTRDGTCERDYVHVCDLARAHREALAYLRGGGDSDVFNIGYGRGATVREVVETVKKVSGVDFPCGSGERRAGDPDRLVADSDKLRRVMGWTPRYDDLETIVAHALAWEKTLLTEA